MFDTMTVTKVVAGLCAPFLVLLLGKFGGELLYDVGGGHGGHDEEHHAAFLIEVDTPAAEEEEIDVAAILALGDAAQGEKVFKKCAACHKLEEGANGTGPSLHAVVGRPVDSIAGFNYSGKLAQAGEAWTPEVLFNFLKSPKQVAPGTSMGFAGLRKDTERADIIAYLTQQ